MTDFGMSQLAKSKGGLTPLTLCPGTLAYMSPESLKEPPQYTEKLDVFSQGVIMIQVCTRQFPDPGPGIKEKDDQQSPTGTIQVPVLESERRKKHIDLIKPTHSLLSIALACLEYKEKDRPTAEKLCQKISALKEKPEYIESTANTIATSGVNATLQQERDELAKQIEEKTQIIASKDEQIATYQQMISAKTDEIMDGEKKNERLRMQLLEVLVDNDQASAHLQETIQQLQRQNSELKIQNDYHTQKQSQLRSTENEIEFKWRDGGNAPFKGSRQGLVLRDNVAYFSSGQKVYSFESSTEKWNTGLPECPLSWGSLAIVQDLLTMVGGRLPSGTKATNRLVSLSNRQKGKWIEQFPPMPTSRCVTTATTYQNHLIVAGGSSALLNKCSLDVVEVLNTDTLVWSTAASLPHPFAFGSATICGGLLYILGGDDKDGDCRSVFSCLLPELLHSLNRRTLAGRLFRPRKPVVWQNIAYTPLYHSTGATVCGQLVAVGGRDDSNEEKSAIYKYDLKTQSWNVISYMTTARSLCYVAAMDTNELLLVSGAGTDGVERANVSYM